MGIVALVLSRARAITDGMGAVPFIGCSSIDVIGKEKQPL